ncbi:MAG: DNA-directed RNA polymerase subunit omega [Planctomycetes bacterium]|nr:DNA-directed RNA polymerase subunit omega [Planctomycetota bacterium]
MLDIETEDQLVLKVGGKLRLTSLMQKRMVELKRGAAPLVEGIERGNLMGVVVEEILQGKIALAPAEECDMTYLDLAKRRRLSEDGSEEKEIYGSDLKRIKEQRIKELSALLNPTKK